MCVICSNIYILFNLYIYVYRVVFKLVMEKSRSVLYQ